jgi:peroxiredoxin
MRRLARPLGLLLGLSVSACKPSADPPSAGATETEGESTGDGDPSGDGDDELPGWPCDPIQWLAGSSPEIAPPLSESGSGIAVAGDRVFVCREGAPLEVWSTAGDSLSLLATVELAGAGCKWIALAPDAQVLALSDPGGWDTPGFVQLVDLGDPLAPVAGASVVGGAPEGLAFSPAGTELLVAARSEGVRVFALTDGLTPSPGYTDEHSDAHAIVFIGEQLWVAEGVHGVRRFEWADPELAPVPVASVALAGVAQDLAPAQLGGVEVLLVANLGGVLAISLASEAVLGNGATRGVSARLASLGDDRVVLADWDALRVVDFANLAAPTIAAHQGELGGVTGGLFGVRDVAVLGPDRWLSSGLRGLELWAYDRACEAPALAAERRRLFFAPDRDDRVLNLRNEGSVELEVVSVSSADPSVSAAPNSFTIAPGGIKAVEVAIEHGEPRLSSLAIHAIHPEVVPGSIELCADCPGTDVGDSAPTLVHLDTHAELWSRERMAGRVVMLAYFATWCSTCNEDMPVYEAELWQAFSESGGLVLGLGDQAPELIAAWARGRGLSFPILLQQDSYERWADPDPTGPYSLAVVLDQGGVVRDIAHQRDIAEWVALFESLL